ncbi:MAG: hypothetical protein SFU25_11695 [Candidatus Caenarcaniphilales bacterium]|nr:hypothetical protein [Candidatus Caenarcaniphilales bacterium]
MQKVSATDYPKQIVVEPRSIKRASRQPDSEPAENYTKTPITKSIDLENAHRQFLHEVCFSWLPKFVTLFLTRTLGNSLFVVKAPGQINQNNSQANASQDQSKRKMSFKPIWDELFIEAGEGLTVYYLVVLLGSLLAKTFSKQLGVPNYELAGMTYRQLKQSINKELEF